MTNIDTDTLKDLLADLNSEDSKDRMRGLNSDIEITDLAARVIELEAAKEKDFTEAAASHLRLGEMLTNEIQHSLEQAATIDLLSQQVAAFESAQAIEFETPAGERIKELKTYKVGANARIDELERENEIFRNREKQIYGYEATIERLRDVVERCMWQFQYYTGQHKRKSTPEGDKKADINRAYADRCQAALGEGGSDV